MANMSVTDINDGATIIVDKQNVAAIYELTDYRIIRMVNGTEYDVSETFEALNADIGGQPITGP